jgi:hypothetical protein
MSNPKVIAELFNLYFVEIVKKLVDQNSETHITYNMTNLKLSTCPETIFVNPVSDVEIERVINFKGKHSSGFDDVPDLVIKKCTKFIKKPLADISNASFESGIFPDRLKLSVIKPLYKKGDTGNIKNYRSVSLL